MAHDNITILNFNTNPSGGAYKAAERLHNSFLAAKYNSFLITKYPNYNDIQNKICYRNTSKPTFIEKVKNRLQYRPKQIDSKYYALHFGEIKSRLSTKELKYYSSYKPNIIILNWVTSFLSAVDIFNLQKITGAKLYWLLLDKGPLTSICHYSWDCENYKTTCTECPISIEKKFNEIVNKTHHYRQLYYNKTKIEIIAPTTKLYHQAKSSSNFKGKTIHLIPLSIDQQTYKPLSKEDCKKKLGIQKEDKVIFFGASRHNEIRKGMHYLNNALTILKEKTKKTSIVLLIAGRDYDINYYAKLGYKIKSMGAINSDKTLNQCYNAADVFISPSIEDSGPMMINECICSQTSIVAFNIGVAPDFIKNRQNGSIVPIYDYTKMANEIYYHLHSNKKTRNYYLTNEGVELIRKLTPSSQIEQIIQLYKNESN